MHFSALFLLPLIQGVLSFGQDLQISSLRTTSTALNRTSSRNSTSVTRINFVFNDLNTNATANCSGVFLPSVVNGSVALPKSYSRCSRSINFSWRFGAFNGIEDFRLDLRRIYRDPSLEGPQNIVKLYAEQNFTAGDNYFCNSTIVPRRTTCETPRGLVLNVPVTAATV